jgi:hypothetical protein
MRPRLRLRQYAATQRGNAVVQALIVAAVALVVVTATLATSFNLLDP